MMSVLHDRDYLTWHALRLARHDDDPQVRREARAALRQFVISLRARRRSVESARKKTTRTGKAAECLV